MRDDGYHQSFDGVKVPASNLRKSLEQVLNAPSFNNGQRNSLLKRDGKSETETIVKKTKPINFLLEC